MRVGLILKFEEEAEYQDMREVDEMVNSWLDRFKEIVDVFVEGMDRISDPERVENALICLEDVEGEIFKQKEAVIKAIDLIFHESNFQKHVYVDFFGDEYTYPGDIKEVIEAEKFLPHRITSPKIGRVMLHDLGLKDGPRKSQGIPYYLKDNKKIIETWKQNMNIKEI